MNAVKEKKLGHEVREMLSQALKALTSVCDGAQQWDGHGFGKYDAERGHRFAKEDPSGWNIEKCGYIHFFLWKYRRQLVEFHGIDLEKVKIPNLSSIGHVQRHVEFRVESGEKFSVNVDCTVPNEFVGKIEKMAEDFAIIVGKLLATKDRLSLMEEKRDYPQVVATGSPGGEKPLARIMNIRMGEGDGNLVFSFSYNPDALFDLKKNWTCRKWDQEDRLWRVNVACTEEADLVTRFAIKYNLTISNDVLDMLRRYITKKSEKGAIETPKEAQSPQEGAATRKEASKLPETVSEVESDSEALGDNGDMGRGWTAGKACKLFE